MIPKVIHYCWFGHNPLPPIAEKCIASWKRYLPDYEIKEWNEENFDVNIVPYTAEAYEAKKYAFVSDFARFWILYHYGGLYFHFKNPDGSNNIKNIVQYTTELLFKEGLKNVGGIQSLHGVTIYPCEYFCPINNVTKKMKITGNTRTIHHYSGSWRDKSFFDKLKERIRLFLPDWILLYYNNKKNTNK